MGRSVADKREREKQMVSQMIALEYYAGMRGARRIC